MASSKQLGLITPQLSTTRFANRLLAWYDQHGRSTLPWQKNTDPYCIWISEIMLQQTQVATVIPYYQRFMQRFPTVELLAAAKLDDVLHHWSGLGYYSRARNIHKAAQIIQQQGQGFPTRFEDIYALPGIGPSTAGAICAFSYNQRQAILDGNVKRVLARFQAVKGWPGKKSIHDLLWRYADYYTPKLRVRQYTQAIMDLGALVCTQSKPDCPACPLNQDCAAHLENAALMYPSKKPKAIKPIKKTHFLIFYHPELGVYLVQRPMQGIWGGLYGFPECQEQDLMTCAAEFGVVVKNYEIIADFRHTFTHYHLDITAAKITVTKSASKKFATDSALWYQPGTALTVGIAAPVKKLLTHMENYL